MFGELVDKFVRAWRPGLDHASIVQEATRGILELGTYGDRGVRVFPSGVTVRVRAFEGRVEGLRKVVESSAFDTELVAELRNRLAAFDQLPSRRYEVDTGETEGVEVVADVARVVLVLVVEGGDRDGARFPIRNVRGSWRVGRGATHDAHFLNDFVLSEGARFVSRAAAVIHHDAGVRIEVRDQREALVVRAASGDPVRPFLTAEKSCPLAPGDVVEFTDGERARLRLLCVAGDSS
jgi:hypothetical protein